MNPDSPSSTLSSPRVEDSQSASLDSLSTPGESAVESRERPTLRKSDTVDSGYSSGEPSGSHTSTPPKPQYFDQIDSRIATYDFPNDLACGDLGPSDWSFYQPQNAFDGVQRNAMDHPNPGITESSSKYGGWADPGHGDISWWSSSAVNRPSAASLITAAKVLEDQAQSLRNLALQHNAGDMDQNRRQTIALPVSQDSVFATVDATTNSVGPVDDMALLFAGRNPATSGLQRGSDFSWYGGHTDNYSSFNSHQLSAFQSQAPHPGSATNAGFTNASWNLVSRRTPPTNGGTFIEAAPEQLITKRTTLESVHGGNYTRSAIMDQPDCSYTWPER